VHEEGAEAAAIAVGSATSGAGTDIVSDDFAAADAPADQAAANGAGTAAAANGAGTTAAANGAGANGAGTTAAAPDPR
jgi:acyl dehydratase